MTRTEVENPKTLVKRIVYLAWQASTVGGMGFLQDRGPEQSEDDVWEHAYDNKDYALSYNQEGRIYCDYVMGRMMKLNVEWDKDHVTLPDTQPRCDYQSWCLKYPTYADLLNQAQQSLMTEV